MTSQYEEFIGKEPSLNQLIKFIKINKSEIDEFNKECIADNNEKEKIDYTVLDEYYDFANKYTGNVYYYIGGHIKTLLDDPITQEAVMQAIKINNESVPQHMMEVSSKIRSSKQLRNLQKILDTYYEKCLEEYYAPPPPIILKENSLIEEQNKILSPLSWLICSKNYSQDITHKGGEGYEKLAKNTIIGKTKIMEYVLRTFSENVRYNGPTNIQLFLERLY
jgi:hypothetical protein